MRRIILLFTAAAMMAVMMAVSAGPASALVIFDRDNDHNDNDRNDHNRNTFFFDRNNDGGVFGPNFDDQELESGSIETETDISIEGNNNNQCVGALQFGQTGNFSNQQGATQFDSGGFFFGHDGNNDRHWWNNDRDNWWDHDNDHFRFFGHDNDNGDLEFSGPEATFAPSNETTCDQEVQQAAAASSSWW